MQAFALPSAHPRASHDVMPGEGAPNGAAPLRARPPMRLKPGPLGLGLVLAWGLWVGGALMPTVAWAAPSGAAGAAAAKPALSVSLVQPETQTWPLRVQAVGSLAPWQEAIVGSEVQGLRLAEVRAQVGDRVQRGQVLAVFASETVAAEVAVARATLAEAEAVLVEATANANRARELGPSGVLSAQQMQQSLTAERTAQARVESARAALQQHQLRLQQTEVRAPDSGLVSARSATVGAVMPAGQELFRLIRQGRLEWRAEVAASELGGLKPGVVALVTPAGAEPLRGVVRQVAPTIDAASRNGLVFVDLPADAVARSGARAGLFARGEFEVGQQAGLTLPQSAVVQRDGFAYVMRVGPDNRVQQQKVELGRRSGDRIEVRAGLAAQARVVASGAAFLADGDTVRVVADTPARTAPSAPRPASR